MRVLMVAWLILAGKFYRQLRWQICEFVSEMEGTKGTELYLHGQGCLIKNEIIPRDNFQDHKPHQALKSCAED